MGTLEGKRALITGSASGIGRAAAILFADQGAAVSMADQDVIGGQELLRELKRAGKSVMFTAGNVASAEDCARIVSQTAEMLGGLDVVVNAAGMMIRRGVVDLDEADWDRVMDVNAKSVYLICKYAVPVMRKSGGGSIVNVASGWGLVGGPEAAAYCASKGAVVLLTKAMAIDHGAEKIRINCLCPGDTDTPMLAREAVQLGTPPNEFLELAARRPLGRIGTPAEIAQAALFLASDASSYITGTTLVVDGGGLAGG